MTFRLKKLFVPCFLFFVLVLCMPSGVHAQYAGTMTDASGANLDPKLPPPPAWVISKRMAAAGDWVDAVKKLRDIPASAMYRGSPYVPEALYTIAHIEEDHLSDNNAALNDLTAIHNSYMESSMNFPHKSVIESERDKLGFIIDAKIKADALKGPSDWSSLPSIWQAIVQSGYPIIDFAVKLTGSKPWSYPLALFLIALVFRLLLWPLTIKQYQSMKEMQRMKPLLDDLKAKYGNDLTTFQTKQAELFKEHNVNPAAGCGPMLIQLPLLLYMNQAVRLYSYQFSHGTFFWINPAAHKLLPLFAPNLAEQDFLMLLVYSVSTYATQRMMPVADPAQAEQMKQSALMSSVVFFFMLQSYHSPSAFVLYWFFTNIVSSAVQLYALRSGVITLAPLATGNTPADGDPELIKGVIVDTSKNDPKLLNGSSGHSYNGVRNGKMGTAKGVISPKIHPKKKKR